MLNFGLCVFLLWALPYTTQLQVNVYDHCSIKVFRTIPIKWYMVTLVHLIVLLMPMKLHVDHSNCLVVVEITLAQDLGSPLKPFWKLLTNTLHWGWCTNLTATHHSKSITFMATNHQSCIMCNVGELVSNLGISSCSKIALIKAPAHIDFLHNN